MSISPMKQALEALDCINPPLNMRGMRKLGEAMRTLREAIAEAEKREWVGLTDEEVYPLANEHLHHQIESYEVSGIYNLARAIEAKLKEKNI